MRFTFFIIVLLSVIGCNKKPATKKQLGEVRMEVSGSSETKTSFEKGLLLLHSFEYEDAREAFIEAQEVDPKMAMAYWGEAMTYNHSLWSEQDFEEATNVLAKLDAINYVNTTTPLEQDLITAVHHLYKPKTEKHDRDVAYSEYMETLTKKYPESHEVAAFYALSLLGSVKEGRDEEIYEKGANIAIGVLNENPKHPGALHYLIHSYDDPEHATLGLDAAQAYATVAPDASHALHMPSHIFVAKGMWGDVIDSNIDSYQASLNRMTRKKLDNDARGYHAFHWLQYGYLQNNEKEKAREMVQEMNKFAIEKPSVKARVHLVFLKGTYLAETNEWNSEIADIPVNLTNLNITIRSQHHFLEGMKAYTVYDSTALQSIITKAENDINKETITQNYGSAAVCANASRGEVTQTDLVESKIRMHQLKGLLAQLNSNFTEAEEHVLAAIELEKSISYSYGPPKIQKPTHELYADWLLGQQRFDEAKKQYDLALKLGPKRRLPLLGIETLERNL